RIRPGPAWGYADRAVTAARLPRSREETGPAPANRLHKKPRRPRIARRKPRRKGDRDETRMESGTASAAGPDLDRASVGDRAHGSAFRLAPPPAPERVGERAVRRLAQRSVR